MNIFSLVIIFTIGGNSLVCIAVIRERHLQNTTNYFLTSLAFTDCLVACLVMPIAAVVEFIGYFPFDSLICNIWLTFDVCCCTSSIWHMR
jgi:dopamine receptor D1